MRCPRCGTKLRSERHWDGLQDIVCIICGLRQVVEATFWARSSSETGEESVSSQALSSQKDSQERIGW